MRPAREAPSLPGHFLLGHLPRRRRDPLALYLEAAEKLGGFTRFELLGKDLYLVTEPDGIQRVLQDNAKNYVKGFGYAAMKTVMGEGLVTAEGKPWLEQRRRCQPAFHMKRLEQLIPNMNAQIDASVAGWANQGEGFDLFRSSLQLSRQIAARALLSVESSVDSFDEIIPVLQKEVSRRSLALFDLKLPFKSRREQDFDAALAKLDAFVYGELRARRASTEKKTDLLQDLLEAYAPEDEKQLRDSLVTLFLAAYETTATSLTWILFLVAQHPEVAEQIAAADSEGFTRQVIEEGMRLYPAVWLFARKAVADDDVLDYRVPAGAYVLISPWVNHRLTRFWDQPEQFRPERFSPANRSQIPKHAFLPFSAGPRQCIGAQFAMLELEAMVTAVVRRYHLELRSLAPPRFDPLITLQPLDGMKLKLTPRST